jgi:alanine racemase
MIASSAIPYRSWVEVSLPTIAANFAAVRSLVGPGVDVMPVVKADAYRHGAIEVSRTLVEHGARWLAVSSVEEGIALRLAGLEPRILVMADFLPGERDALVEHDLTPVIHDLADLKPLNGLAERHRIRLNYHLKLDTGMGRLGTRSAAGEIAHAVRGAPAVRLEGLMTHFASSADYSGAQTDEQSERFDELIQELLAEGVAAPLAHAASTNSIAYGRRQAWKTTVRPGHAIYGYVSPPKAANRAETPERLLSVAPALAWKAAILAAKDVPAGTSLGYGAMFVTPQPMRIGILAAGYADGLPHRLSGRGKVIAAGQPTPILGAVSMDLTTIDLTHAPHLKPGDAVTLIGREGDAAQDAQQLARAAGTISYALLCGISARVKRVHV